MSTIDSISHFLSDSGSAPAQPAASHLGVPMRISSKTQALPTHYTQASNNLDRSIQQSIMKTLIVCAVVREIVLFCGRGWTPASSVAAMPKLVLLWLTGLALFFVVFMRTCIVEALNFHDAEQARHAAPKMRATVSSPLFFVGNLLAQKIEYDKLSVLNRYFTMLFVILSCLFIAVRSMLAQQDFGLFFVLSSPFLGRLLYYNVHEYSAGFKYPIMTFAFVLSVSLINSNEHEHAQLPFLLDIALAIVLILCKLQLMAMLREESMIHETALLKKQAIMDAIYSNVPNLGVWMCDPTLHLHDVRMHSSLSSAQYENQPLEESFSNYFEPSDDGMRLYVDSHRSALSGRTASYTARCKSNQHRYAVTVQPEYDSKTRDIIGAIGVAFDIEDVMLSTEMLAQEQERSKAILSAISEDILHINADLQVDFANHDMFGHKCEELIGLHLLNSSLMGQSVMLKSFVQDHCQQVLLTGTPSTVAWLCTVRDNDTELQSQLDDSKISPQQELALLNEERVQYKVARLSRVALGGGDSSIILSVTDLTERRKRYHHEKIAEEHLSRSQFKSTFIRTLAHELKSPLQSLITLLALLACTKPLNTAQTEYISDASDSARMMMSILADVLDVEKLAAGKVQLVDQTVNIVDVLETLVDMYQGMAAQKSLDIWTDIDLNLPLFIVSDRTRLAQILQNLLSNAIKFTDTGRILISAKCVEESSDECVIQLSVNDTGCGISSPDLARVFEPFEQVQFQYGQTAEQQTWNLRQTPRNPSSGWGLGLSICSSLCALMNGTISASSLGRGHGSTFTVRIPCKKFFSSSRTIQRVHNYVAKCTFAQCIVVHRYDELSSILVRYLSALGCGNAVHVNPEKLQLDAEELKDYLVRMSGAKPSVVIVDSLYAPVLKLLPQDRFARLLLSSPDMRDALTEAYDGPGFYAINKPIRLTRLMHGLYLLGHVSDSKTQDDFEPPDLLKIVTNSGLDLSQVCQGEDWILYADDDPLLRKVFAQLLHKLGIQNVEVASNGVELVKAINKKDRAPLLVLCDINMGGSREDVNLDGPAALERVRSLDDVKKRSTPFIAVTGSMDFDFKARGFNEMLCKPYTAQQLATVLIRFLGGPSASSPC